MGNLIDQTIANKNFKYHTVFHRKPTFLFCPSTTERVPDAPEVKFFMLLEVTWLTVSLLEPLSLLGIYQQKEMDSGKNVFIHLNIPWAPRKSLPHLCLIVTKSKIHFQWEGKQKRQGEYGQRQRKPRSPGFSSNYSILGPGRHGRKLAGQHVALSFKEKSQEKEFRWEKRALSQPKETSLKYAWSPLEEMPQHVGNLWPLFKGRKWGAVLSNSFTHSTMFEYYVPDIMVTLNTADMWGICGLTHPLTRRGLHAGSVN